MRTLAVLVASLATLVTAHAGSPAPTRLPLTFERNDGQTDPSVQYLSRGQDQTLFLTRTGAVWTLPGGAIRLSLAGGSARPEVRGEDALAGRSNYFLGRDPAKWHRGVPNYASVRYAEVYPGIDLVYHGDQKQLEFDFEVAPGADPQAIAIDVSAVGRRARPRIEVGGDLVLPLGDSEARFQAPTVYQILPDGGRQSVPGRFALRGKRRVGFEVGAYDRARPLVIDPVLAYASYLGGAGRRTRGSA